MERYRNIDCDSGVQAFEIGQDYIKIQFLTGTPYIFSYINTGSENIEIMKRLAKSGEGLNAFINTVVKKIHK